MIKILNIAKLPPPIGGVTIHVQRLMERVEAFDDMEVEVLDYSQTRNIIVICKKIYNAEVLHIHLSNKIARFVLVLISRLLRKKSLVTFHGKYDFKSRYDRYVLKMSSYSIVLNNYTYKNAQKYKINNIKLMGAFIPPIEENIEELDKEVVLRIEEYRKNYENMFCVNASNYVLDERGEETYMGTELMVFFSNYHSGFLVFSDPTGNYKKFFTEQNITIPKNVYIIDKPHDFINIIKMSDAFIRATTMDGDSLSVKEALYYGVPVFATDIVDRPSGVILFKDFDDLSIKVDNIKKERNKNTVVDSTNEIIEVYRHLKNL